jgi:hypothetical protein
MCVASWSLAGFVKISDIMVATGVPEGDPGVEEELENNWDAITT